MSSVELSEQAIAELKKIKNENDFADDVGLRIGVKGGGCSGFSYVMEFDEDEPAEVDEIIDIEGIAIYVDKKSMLYLDGIKIDFHEDLMQRGFVFQNPNASGTCGCGSSFGV